MGAETIEPVEEPAEIIEPVEEPAEIIEPIVEETAVESEANEVIEPAETIELIKPAETIEPVEEPAKEIEPILEDIVLENEVVETILETIKPILESVEPAKESEPILEIGIGAKVNQPNEGRALQSSGMNLAPFSTVGILFLSILVLLKN